MSVITFTVPGRPVAKGRARAFIRNGKIGMHTPDRTAAYERQVGTIAAPHFPEPITGPVRLDIVAVFSPAASWSKKRRAEAMGGWHTQKPDRDNIEKAIKDGLNRIAWGDDCQVADGSCRKVWGEVEGVHITVTPLGGVIVDAEVVKNV